MSATEDQFIHSSLREGLIEHLLVGEVMRHLWVQGCRDFELLRPTTDAAGYDVVMSAYGQTRHIQLKASGATATTSKQNINTALMRHASGCVVWARFDVATMTFSGFLWFGGTPSSPLPDLGNVIAKRTTPKTDGTKPNRPNIRSVPKGRFEQLNSIADLTFKLFGVI